jgi:hypothetical protein
VKLLKALLSTSLLSKVLPENWNLLTRTVVSLGLAGVLGLALRAARAEGALEALSSCSAWRSREPASTLGVGPVANAQMEVALAAPKVSKSFNLLDFICTLCWLKIVLNQQFTADLDNLSNFSGSVGFVVI